MLPDELAKALLRNYSGVDVEKTIAGTTPTQAKIKLRGRSVKEEAEAVTRTASRVNGGPVLVGWDDKTPASMSLGLGLASKISSAGREVWVGGTLSLSAFRYALAHYQIPGCYAQGIAGHPGAEGTSPLVSTFSTGGLPLTQEESQALEKGVNSGNSGEVRPQDYGIITECRNLQRAYALFLRELLGGSAFCEVSFSSPDRELSAIANTLFSGGSTHNEKAPLVVYLSADGSAARFYTKETGYIPWDKVLLLGCGDFFERGEQVSLPFSTPSAADILAGKYGTKPMRYYISSNGEDKEARKLALKQTFPRDGLETTIRILKWLKRGEGTAEMGWGELLKGALKSLPPFDTATRYLPIHPNHTPEKVLERLAEDATPCPEGILTRTEKGRVLLRPAHSGRGIMVFAESFMSESAEELCSFYEMILSQSK